MGSLIHVTMLTVPAEDAELAADALWEAGASGVEERAGPTSATVTLVADATPVASRHGWRTETAEVDDGLDSWRAYARPWTAGRFRIRPPWLPAPGTDADAAGIDLVIDPGHSFGSGSHPTTRLVLAELEDVVGAGTRVLDVGCGSGVLAIAAALLGADVVDAVDTDPAAHEATAANARANGVAVRLVPGADLESTDGTYDVVVANIGAATLRALAPMLASRGTCLVLSGVLDEQADEVMAAYAAAAGCVEAGRRHQDGWVVLVLRKGA